MPDQELMGDKDFSSSDNLLSEKGLKITRQRLAVLSYFKDGDTAVSHHDIQATVASGIDRVSLYRILDLFTQNMIVFKLADHGGTCYYILNRFILNKEDWLSLMKCEYCNKVSALPLPPLTYIKLLKQYHVQPQLLFNGNCDKCSHD